MLPETCGSHLSSSPFFLLICSATGASCCYWLSYGFGRSAAERFFPSQLKRFRELVDAERARGNLLPYCLFLRVFPFSPNFFLNIASPLVHLPFAVHLMSVLVGLMPYNFLSVSAGRQLAQLTDTSQANAGNTVKLLGLSLLILLPTVFKRKLQRLNPFAEASGPDAQKQE
jgi:uncharacterized membrane protein YdjX (TVP38/TMEM64 family)